MLNARAHGFLMTSQLSLVSWLPAQSQEAFSNVPLSAPTTTCFVQQLPSMVLLLSPELYDTTKDEIASAKATVTAGNLTSMMSSSNGASLDALRALGSISSSGIVPAFGQLAQRGAMGGYPAAMLQQQGMQQYLSQLPWMLRMQVGKFYHVQHHQK